MADFRAAIAVRQAMGDAATALVDAGAGPGLLRIYAGTIPASVDNALAGTETLLATLTFSDPAFGATDTSGVATANAMTGDSAADATGDATFFRIEDSAGNVLFQGDVTAMGGGGDLELNSVSVQAGVEVSISSLTITVPEA